MWSAIEAMSSERSERRGLTAKRMKSDFLSIAVHADGVADACLKGVDLIERV